DSELVEIGRAARHHATVVGAGVPDTDVVAHDHDDVGLLLRGCRRACRHHGKREQRETNLSGHTYHALPPIALSKPITTYSRATTSPPMNWLLDPDPAIRFCSNAEPILVTPTQPFQYHRVVR